MALERNKRSYQVTCADDMEAFWFENYETVGISAGASTPDDIIRDVVEKIKEIGHVTKEETVYE